VAVLCVVFYHLELFRLPGGFVGVDVFFVISGYLITQVIQQEIDRGHFTFLWFYGRRIRRIFPALVAMSLVCSTLAVRLFPPARLLSYGRSLLAMTGFVSNIYFKRLDANAGYFGNLSHSQLLLHTWSLSVEEQFYIFYPVVLLLLNRLAKRYRAGVLLLCIGLSFAASAVGTRLWPVASFYLLPTRAWELLLGAFLGLKALPTLSSRLAREFAGAAGLGMIAYSVETLSVNSAFPGINALLPCVGAGLVLYAGESGESLTGWGLSLRPVVFIGLVSYSLYLWHWPVLIFARYLTAGRVGRLPGGIALLVSLALAILSFEFVETPFRRRPWRMDARQTVWAAAVSAALAAVAFAMVASEGMPNRFDARTKRLLSENETRKNEFGMPRPCINYQTALKQYSDMGFCEIGLSSSNVLVWGDSHAEQLYTVLRQLQPELRGQGVVFATAAGCPPSEHFNHRDGNYSCGFFNRFAMQRAIQGDISTVLIEFAPWWYEQVGILCAIVDGHCIEAAATVDARRRIVEDLASSIRTLQGSGKRVIVGLPFPTYTRQIPDYEANAAIVGRRWMAGEPQENSSMKARELLQALARDTGADLYDPREALCVGGRCVYEADGVSLYKDDNHLAANSSGILKTGLVKVLEPRGGAQ
jgi:peptidoglycan/LPS O-acetylase OafA/YrhL